MNPFTIPHSQTGRPLARRFWSLEQLQDHLSNLETLQEQIIASQVQHLDELATLNRMAAALSERRSFDEVINDTLQEVYMITSCREAWVIDSTPTEPIGSVHCLNDPVIGHSDLPKAVIHLARMIHTDADAKVRVLGRGKSSSIEGLLVAFPILTNKHLLGCLVVHCVEHDITTDEHTLKLIQSMLRQTAVACENDRLVEAVGAMMIECVYGFAQAIESRDPYTGGHVQRVTAFALLLAKRLGMTQRDRAIIQIGGLLHDIGKIAVPDAILRKPGKLEAQEFEIIKTHPVVGYDMISQIPHLGAALAVVRHHHERWDGKGYPDGLMGQQIPLVARVLAIADAFDAMTSSRPYRPGMSFEVAMQEIASNAGKQFDAELVHRFVQLQAKDFDLAAQQMADWCNSHDHPGTVNVTELLELDMKRLPYRRRSQSSTWQRPVTEKTRGGSDMTMMGGSAISEQPASQEKSDDGKPPLRITA